MKVVGGQMTLDAIATSMFGIEIDSFKEPENRFRVQALTLVGAPGYASQVFMIKAIFFMIFPRFSKFLGLKWVSPSVMKFFTDIISKTYHHRLNTGERRNDLIDVIADEMKSYKSKADKPDDKAKEVESEFEKDAVVDTTGIKVSDFDEELLLVSNAILFFFAGFDTNSQAISMCCHKLALYPDIQDRVIEEIEDVLADGPITYEAMQELKYLDMFISESFRSQAILGYHERKCTKDYKIPGTDIVVPKDRFVHVMTDKMIYSKDYFINPDNFDPENFNPENKPNNFGNQFFGQGPRNCIGMRYALLVVKIFLISMLRRHRLVRGTKTVDELVMDVNNPNIFKGGVFVKVEKR